MANREEVAAKLMRAANALGGAEGALEELIREMSLSGSLQHEPTLRATYEELTCSAPDMRVTLRSLGMALDRAAFVKADDEHDVNTAFEVWHAALCCESCARTCPHKEWERKAFAAGYERGRT